jgi:hypothetical protein
MKQLLRLFLLGMVGVLLNRPATAQTLDEPSTEAAAPDTLDLIKGFALAHITEPNGQTHQVYVPAGQPGFVGMLPFYRRETEIRALGQPWSISVDKVQKMRLYGVYYEHMVVQGKRKHLLAARVAHGPVELFNYTEVTQMLPGGLVGAAVAGAILAGTGGQGLAERRWYLRRGTELIQVKRDTFTEQMSEYFKDDPATVAALLQKQVHYPDMLAIVLAYNQHKLVEAQTTK